MKQNSYHFLTRSSIEFVHNALYVEFGKISKLFVIHKYLVKVAEKNSALILITATTFFIVNILLFNFWMSWYKNPWTDLIINHVFPLLYHCFYLVHNWCTIDIWQCNNRMTKMLPPCSKISAECKICFLDKGCYKMPNCNKDTFYWRWDNTRFSLIRMNLFD